MGEVAPDGDCPICLMPLLHAVKLPCRHVFCFLCLKGSAFHRRRCPLCRSPISMNYFDAPILIEAKGVNSIAPDVKRNADFVWFYEGFNGWWQYDNRTALDIEAAFSKSMKECEVFIAGHVYVVDFLRMCQMRKDHSGRSRRIKRDSARLEKKGIAGIRQSFIDQTGRSTGNECYDIQPSTSNVNNGSHDLIVHPHFISSSSPISNETPLNSSSTTVTSVSSSTSSSRHSRRGSNPETTRYLPHPIDEATIPLLPVDNCDSTNVVATVNEWVPTRGAPCRIFKRGRRSCSSLDRS